MHRLALALLLVACSGDETSAPTSSGGGDAAAQVGSGGADGDGGAGITSAQSSTAEATTGTGGDGGEAASTTSAGGSGGAGSTTTTGVGGSEPCEVGCVANARVRCNEACPNHAACEPLACAEGDVFDGLSLQGGENRIELPPIPVQHPRCQSCGADVLYAQRLLMPGYDRGCVSVDVPPGIRWDISEADAPPVCPEERRECGLGAFTSDFSALYLVVTEPSSEPQVVTVTVTQDELCVGVPLPVCAAVCP